MEKIGKRHVSVLFSILVLSTIGWALLNDNAHRAAVAASLTATAMNIAAREVIQFDLVKHKGNATDTCLQATIVADAYGPTGDFAAVEHWSQLKRQTCRAAGVPGDLVE